MNTHSTETISGLKHFGFFDWAIAIFATFCFAGSIIQLPFNLWVLPLLLVSLWGMVVKVKKYKDSRFDRAAKKLYIVLCVIAAVIIIPAVLAVLISLNQ